MFDVLPLRRHTVTALLPVPEAPLVEIVLRRYGNSTVAVLPPGVLRDLGLAAGQAMTLSTTPAGQIVLAPRRRHALADLIAQCDPDAPPPADLGLWDTTPPAGGEAW